MATKTQEHPRASAPNQLRVITVLALLFIIWANSFHSIAYFRTRLGVSASALVTMRYGPVVPFCLVWCLIRRQRLREMLRRDWWRVLLMGLCIVPIYNLALNWGQGRVPPATASLIISLNPLFTFLLALVFLDERARWTKLGGLALAFLGVYLLVSTQHKTFGSGYVLSALVLLMAPLSWAISTVIGKPVAGRTDPLLLTFAATGIGSLPFLGMLVAGTGGVHRVFATMPATGWIALLHLTILCTIVGFAVWFWALSHLSASTVSAFVFLNPPLTSLFGMIWGTEVFHWSTAAFGSITLLGVALSAGLLNRPKVPGDLHPEGARSTR